MRTADPSIFEYVRTLAEGEALGPKVDLTIRGGNGQSLLHEAIAFHKPAVAKDLIRRGIDLNLRNRKGETALHYAAVYRADEIAELLLRNGADPNLTEAFGNGAVWTAAMHARGDYRVVSLMVAHGADVNHKNKAGKSLLDFARESNNRPLWLAAGGKEAEF